MKLTRAEIIAKNRADERIAVAYRKHCRNIQISVLDIPELYKRGHEMIAQGANDETLAAGILAFVQTIAK